MKIAFAHWNNRIAPVFDTARRIHVVETESGRVISQTPDYLPENLPVQKTLRLAELGIQILVCGAISRPMHGLVAAYGIQVISFVAGNLQDVIQACLRGDLERDAYAMPGCRGRWRQRSRGMHEKIGGDTMTGKGRGMGAGNRKGQGQGGAQRPRRKGGDPSAGSDNCVCPQCGQTEPHERGVPCMQLSCPKCGSAMVRE